MKGQLFMQLRAPDGRLLAERRAHNAVMQTGGNLVARLFAGQLTAGITHMGVGTSDTPETDRYATTALANPDGPDSLTGGTEAAIAPEQVAVLPPDETTRTIKVRIRGTLPAGAGIGTIREAGLLSRAPAASPSDPAPAAVLYNRVIFAPLTKGNDHELTLFWEVTFPYGDLQELL